LFVKFNFNRWQWTYRSEEKTMTLKKRDLLSAVCGFALATNGLIGWSAMAQDESQKKTKVITNQVITEDIKGPGPEDVIFRMPAVGMWTAQAPETFGFVTAEMNFDGKVVKGAPFSAEAVTEFTQILGDGNRIVRKTTANLHRDGEGRTRREEIFSPLAGPAAGNVDAPKHSIISIIDPVSGAHYTLDQQTRTAHKLPNFGPGMGVMVGGAAPALHTMGGTAVFSESGISVASASSTSGSASTATVKQVKMSGNALQGSAVKKVQPVYPAVAKAAGADGAVRVQVTINEGGDVTEASIISGHPLLRDSALEAAKQWKFKPLELKGENFKATGILTFNFTLDKKPSDQAATAALPVHPTARVERVLMPDSNQESLGKQTIDGVVAEGTRAIQTIPAGAIGNERPIQIVFERWYSPELQTVIMTRQLDPRFGETVFRRAGSVITGTHSPETQRGGTRGKADPARVPPISHFHGRVPAPLPDRSSD
jgi:TonB family protein